MNGSVRPLESNFMVTLCPSVVQIPKAVNMLKTNDLER
jgi:hypothetical protein